MSEMKSLLGSEVGNGAGSCYAELLALRFFRRAVKNYTNKKIDDDLFRPLVRNIFKIRIYLTHPEMFRFGIRIIMQ